MYMYICSHHVLFEVRKLTTRNHYQSSSMEKYLLENNSTNQKQASVIVVMVPLPAQGHLNQLSQLSCIISSYNMSVHFVGSDIHNRQVKTRRHGLSSDHITKIKFHDFPIPSFMSPLPNPDAMVKFPAHLMPPFEASLHLRPHVSNLISTLSAEAKRIIIIHDSLMASVVQDACSIPNVEIYAFQSTSAFTFFVNMWDALGKPFPTEAEIPTELPSLEGCFTSKIMNLMAYQFEFHKFKAGDIYNTSRVIENTYLDLLQTELANESKQLWAIGPLNTATLCYNRTSNGQQHKSFEWLDKQAPNSVLYISFGTTTSMADQQITELALGLEQSEIKFLWVLRDADKGNVFTEEVRIPELPKGFEEKVKAMAMVVRDWAPQQKILGHSSTGGFMSHCGWNSCMESISMGVPIEAWPMHSDQPRNAVLITELLKVGLSVKEWANRDKLLTSSMIRIAVRKLMASTEGDAMRKRAEILGRAVRQSTAEDGVSRKELDSFIAHISR